MVEQEKLEVFFRRKVATLDSEIWGFSAIERMCQRQVAGRREGVDDALLRFGGFIQCSDFRVSAREGESDGERYTNEERASTTLLLPERKPGQRTESCAVVVEEKSEVGFGFV